MVCEPFFFSGRENLFVFLPGPLPTGWAFSPLGVPGAAKNPPPKKQHPVKYRIFPPGRGASSLSFRRGSIPFFPPPNDQHCFPAVGKQTSPFFFGQDVSLFTPFFLRKTSGRRFPCFPWGRPRTWDGNHPPFLLSTLSSPSLRVWS